MKHLQTIRDISNTVTFQTIDVEHSHDFKSKYQDVTDYAKSLTKEQYTTYPFNLTMLTPNAQYENDESVRFKIKVPDHLYNTDVYYIKGYGEFVVPEMLQRRSDYSESYSPQQWIGAFASVGLEVTGPDFKNDTSTKTLRQMLDILIEANKIGRTGKYYTNMSLIDIEDVVTWEAFLLNPTKYVINPSAVTRTEPTGDVTSKKKTEKKKITQGLLDSVKVMRFTNDTERARVIAKIMKNLDPAVREEQIAYLCYFVCAGQDDYDVRDTFQRLDRESYSQLDIEKIHKNTSLLLSKTDYANNTFGYFSYNTTKEQNMQAADALIDELDITVGDLSMARLESERFVNLNQIMDQTGIRNFLSLSVVPIEES